MLKRFKPLLCFLLALMLCVSLCACGGEETSSGSSTASNTSSDTNPFKVKLNPKLIQPQFETLDSVVAVANILDYGADPTGKTDSTKAIRNAMRDAGLGGGGTVWCPKGQYLVTSSLSIPNLVTLRGDWNDPDAADFNGDHGTVILAKPQPSTAENTGLFFLSASSGIEGLTVYYPDQSIDNVTPYSPTVYFPGGTMLRTVKNMTFLNSYVGVCIDHNESSRLRNLKITALKTGVSIRETADVGLFDQITVSPRYWANAGEGMTRAESDKIVKYCKQNKRIGIQIQDVEQQQFSRLKVDGYYYGIFFPSKPTRFMGSGPMFDLQIKNCTYGLYAESGTYVGTWAADKFPVQTGVDWRCGYNISYATIEGSKYSIYNDSDTVLDSNGTPYTGYFRLTDVTLKGGTHGNVQRTTHDKTADLSKQKMQDYRTVKTTGKAFEVLFEGASEAQIQAALDKVGKAGGGVVFLAGGDYEIASGLTVPKNTELMGAAGSAHRIPNVGTVLWCRQKGSTRRMLDAKALVTLAGDNSGVSGIYFMYDENIILIGKRAQALQFPFAVRGQGKGVWAIDCCIAGASHGIDFTNCDNHVIEDPLTCCIDVNMQVSGNNGMICNGLSNATILQRNNAVVRVQNGDFTSYYFDYYGRARTAYIKVGAGSGQQLYNTFIYGGNRVIVLDEAKQVNGINLCSDHIKNCFLDANQSSAVITNIIITSGGSYKHQLSSLRIYNPQLLMNQSPNDFIVE